MSGNNASDFVLGLNEYKSDLDLAGVELFRDYPESLLLFAFICCVIFIIIGIPGNVITIIALSRCKKVRNATAVFIINLSCSDLLFCCFNLPLAASTFWEKAWKNGIVLCRLFPLLRYSLVAVSLFTVLAITVNRYIMIIHPILYAKLYTKRNLTIMIVCIWILPFGFLAATLFEAWGQFSLDPMTGSCTIVPDEHDNSPKKFLFIAAFLLPSVAIIACYARILWVVRKSTKNSKKPTLKMQPTAELPSTIIEIPETALTTISEEPVKRKRPKSRLIISCLAPELSSSSNESTTLETDDRQCAPEFKPSPLKSESAKQIRRSFITTFRRSTAFIKPRMPTKKDKKLLTMIVAIITSFCICHLPITLTKTIFSEFTSHPHYNIAGYVLIYLTTCINPIIYVVMSSEYRQAYKNLFTCGFLS